MLGVLGDAEERVSVAELMIELFTIAAPIGAVLALGGFAFGVWRGTRTAQRFGVIAAMIGAVFALSSATISAVFKLPPAYLFVPGACLISIAAGLVCAFRIKNVAVGAIVAAAVPFALAAMLASL